MMVVLRLLAIGLFLLGFVGALADWFIWPGAVVEDFAKLCFHLSACAAFPVLLSYRPAQAPGPSAEIAEFPRRARRGDAVGDGR